MSDYLFSTNVLKSVGNSIRSLDGSTEKMRASDLANRYASASAGYVHPSYDSSASNVFVASMNGSGKKVVFDHPWMIRAAKGSEKVLPYFYVILYVATNATVQSNEVHTLITSNKYLAYVNDNVKYTGFKSTPSKNELVVSSMYSTEIVDEQLEITFDANFADADYDVYAICFKMEEGTAGTFPAVATSGKQYAIDEAPFENLYDQIFTGEFSSCKVPLNQLGAFIKFYNRSFPFSDTHCIDGQLVKAEQSIENTSFLTGENLEDSEGGLFRYTDGSSETSGDYTKCWDKVITFMFEQQPAMAGANRVLFNMSANDNKLLNAYNSYGWTVNLTSSGAATVTKSSYNPQTIIAGTCYLQVTYPKQYCYYRNNTNYRTGTGCDYITLTVGIGRKNPPTMFDFSVYDFGE